MSIYKSRQERDAEAKLAQQRRLQAALSDGANRARADELLAQLSGSTSGSADDALITVTAVAALVLDGALERVFDTRGKTAAAALRTVLRQQRR